MAGAAVAQPGQRLRPNMPTRLVVLYDERCALCRRCRHWLEWQHTFVALEFLPAGSDEARARYGAVPWLGSELVVVDEEGAAWIGPAAFIVCLWATRDWREWSYRLSGPSLAPLAELFFRTISARRSHIAGMLREPRCADEQCGHRRNART